MKRISVPGLIFILAGLYIMFGRDFGLGMGLIMILSGILIWSIDSNVKGAD